MSLMHRARGAVAPTQHTRARPSESTGQALTAQALTAQALTAQALTLALRVPLIALRPRGDDATTALLRAWVSTAQAGTGSGDALLEFTLPADGTGASVTLRSEPSGTPLALAGLPRALLPGSVRATRQPDASLGLLHARVTQNDAVLLEATFDTRTGRALYARTSLWPVLGVEGGRYEVER